MSRSLRLARLALPLAAALAVAAPPPADAHKQSIKLGVAPKLGTTSPIKLNKVGSLSIVPIGGGKVLLALKNVRDVNGNKLTALNNQLKLTLRVNGVVTLASYTFNIKNARGSLHDDLLPTQLYKGDLVELLAVEFLDKDGIAFAVIGVGPETRTPIVRSAVTYVIDSVSPIHFSRGGDTRLKLRDNGNFNTGFDTLLDSLGQRITQIPGVTVELELVRNGGAPEIFTYSYDIIHGRSVPNGRPAVEIGLNLTDHVEVKRLDLFDAMGNRFATLGLQITSPPPP